MKLHLIPILAALALTGCASATNRTLPVCDGKHLRPANPNGSVLDAATPPAANVVAPPPAPAAPQPGCGA